MSNQGHSSATKKLTSVIIVLAILVVVALGVILFLVLGKDSDDNKKNEISGGRGTVITEQNAEEILQNTEDDVQDGYYTTSMSINWHFDGKVSKDAYVANDTSNTRTVYFDLFLRDTNEMIYSSPYIPVGAELDGITLDKELEPGTYKTILVYHLVDNDKQEISTVSVGLTIYVQ